MNKPNPYRPGAGLMPVYLAGRTEEIRHAEMLLDALVSGIPTQSVIYSGLRGVGKTVLLNTIEEKAELKGILHVHFEVDAKSDFIVLINNAVKKIARSISAKVLMQDVVQNLLDALKSLVVSFNPGDGTISLSAQEKAFYLSDSLTATLTDVFVSLGEMAKRANVHICFFVDEIQFMKSEELSALIAALHRSNQLGHPIMLVGTGLPKILKSLGDAKSYSERLFEYHTIGSLDDESAKNAITEPARKLGVSYSEEAIEQVLAKTGNYPYFIQQFCKIIWEQADQDEIDAEMVEQTEKEYLRQLDEGFFRVRYERCTDNEKNFIRAMVECGALPCTIANVAKNLGSRVQSVSPVRAQLINKGIIYAVRHSELDFTVPAFDQFLKRELGLDE